jgi:integrative and conjugative element protein (TIGR02256 family)
MSKKRKKTVKKLKSKKLIPCVIISPEVTAKIRHTAILSGKFETGGLLLGEKKIIKDKYSFIIKKATGPGSNAEFSTHHFIPDVEFYKKELKKELHLNGLIYLGEWHKHPGSYDEPSCTDLETMKEITTDDQTKDLVAIIATTPNQTNKSDQSEMVNIDCYYYQRGMKDFIMVRPDFAIQPNLKKSCLKIEGINLDNRIVNEIAEYGDEEFVIYGSATDNNIANFIKHDNKNDLKAKLLLNNNTSEEISINTGNEDLLIIISVSPEEIRATGWQKDLNTNELNEINVQLIDLQQTLFKRLGGLNIKENIESKNVALLGLGSVGSQAVVQLVKAGVKNIILIDPDQLKIHNIIRHACDLNDLGRNKTDAVEDKLKRINPEINVQKIQKDFVDHYDDILIAIKDSDLLIVSTDTADSRNLANMASVKLNIPAVFISLHERAQTGTIIRIVPGKTGCRMCVGDGRWGGEMIPGTSDYSTAENERDIYYQPGLDTDISLVTNLGVKMAISTLLNPNSEVSPELNTNFIYWNGYPGIDGSFIKLADGIGIPKNEDCDICGNNQMNEADYIYMDMSFYNLGWGN